jgi:hypothetical protein
MIHVDLIRSNLPVQITVPLQLLQATTLSNTLGSALNTNINIGVSSSQSEIHHLTAGTTYFSGSDATSDVNSNADPCYVKSSVSPAGFYSLPLHESAKEHHFWPKPLLSSEPIPSALVDGFFGGCVAFDALLASTLYCLYNVTCLSHFVDYFPDLRQV